MTKPSVALSGSSRTAGETAVMRAVNAAQGRAVRGVGRDGSMQSPGWKFAFTATRRVGALAEVLLTSSSNKALPGINRIAHPAATTALAFSPCF